MQGGQSGMLSRGPAARRGLGPLTPSLNQPCAPPPIVPCLSLPPLPFGLRQLCHGHREGTAGILSGWIPFLPGREGR